MLQAIEKRDTHKLLLDLESEIDNANCAAWLLCEITQDQGIDEPRNAAAENAVVWLARQLLDQSEKQKELVAALFTEHGELKVAS